jgi:ribosomal protein L37AE/L43A
LYKIIRFFKAFYFLNIKKYGISRLAPLMNNSIECKFCGYTPPPQEQPRSGTWFCPKCGKSVSISQPVNLPKQVSPKNLRRSIKSRDQISNQIYSNITKKMPSDLGLKEKYLNPRFEPIVPKKRKKVKIFSKGRED